MEEHTHSHAHEHGCGACGGTSAETLALLKYMLDHNRHHADELHELAHGLDGEARELIHGAVIDIETSNGKIAKAIRLIEEAT